MWTNEERVAEAKRRIADRQRQRNRRNCRAVVLAAVSVCIFLIAGLSFLMPGIAAGITSHGYADMEMAASVFGDSAVLGYIVIGLLAFLLGVCVTVLGFYIRRLQQEDEGTKEEEKDGAGR